jgi:enamine deaminase RidA (YjgF/YER057c/UK114 family)
MQVSTLSPSESVDSHGCSIALRRIEGLQARELFFSCQPPTDVSEPGQQAQAIYRAVLSVLQAEGGSFESVVCETLFLRHLQENIEAVRASREQTLNAHEVTPCSSAITEIEQAPLNEHALLEVLVQAVIHNESAAGFEPIQIKPVCDCAECARSHGLRVQVGDETRFYAGGIYGSGENAYEQTYAMFETAEKLLQQAGMEFGDVMRTWLYLPQMYRDYPELNRARHDFFEARAIDPIPASTGIGAGLVPEQHQLCLGVYAVKATPATERAVMTTPTLNEAPVYGADFSRGMRIMETNKIALHISGTASLDETGKSVHLNDFEAQADRMLLNVAALLEGQGATFRDVVSAITYLKHPEDAERLRDKFRKAGYEGFPNVLVTAPVCRPELLCETEALAVLSRLSDL